MENRLANLGGKRSRLTGLEGPVMGHRIPIWVSNDYDEVVCPGGIEELRHLSGVNGALDDFHRDKIDWITMPSSRNKGALWRIDEIFDCW